MSGFPMLSLSCPHCSAALLVSPATGDVQLDGPQEQSKISVVHATPEYYKYYDPTHINARPKEEPSLEPLPDPIKAINIDPALHKSTDIAVQTDLKQRRLIP